MKWVLRRARWVAGELGGLGLAVQVNGAGDGEVDASVGELELTRGAVEATGFAAALAAAISL